MGEHNEDRRARKSKAAIKKVFCELISKKDIQNITIAELTDLADVNRGTFYLHYQDIYDLMHKIEDEFIKGIKDILTDIPKDLTIESKRQWATQRFLEYLYENRDIAEILLSKRGNISFLEKMKSTLEENIYNVNPVFKNHKNLLPINYVSAFFSSGVVGIAQEWAKNNFSPPAKELFTSINQFVKIFHGQGAF